MNMSIFTGFEGRISRQPWWLGSIALIVVAIVLYLILGAIFGVSLMPAMNPAGFGDAMASMMRKLSIMQLIITLLIAYPATALMKKRLNDRDRPAWFVYAFWAPTVLSLLLNITGLGLTTRDVGGVSMPAPTALGSIVGYLSLAVGIWALVELGFLRGTQGPNQNGPDPLA